MFLRSSKPSTAQRVSADVNPAVEAAPTATGAPMPLPHDLPVAPAVQPEPPPPEAAPVGYPASGPIDASDFPSVLSRGVHIKGQIRASGQLHLDGSVEGAIETPKLTLGECGEVRGELSCKQAMINGRVEGAVDCGALEVGQAAFLTGTVRCHTLKLSFGAVINADVFTMDPGDRGGGGVLAAAGAPASAEPAVAAPAVPVPSPAP